MKKKVFAIALALTALLAFTACGDGDEKVIDNKTGSTTGSDSETSTDGFVFEINGVSLPIGAEADDLIEALGEAKSVYEVPSCAFGDLDVIYTYAGFDVETYQEDSVNYISSISLTDDSVSTPEGLSLGDSYDKIAELYGEPTSDDGATVLYRFTDMKLMILVEDDAITSIQYLNTLLDE